MKLPNFYQIIKSCRRTYRRISPVVRAQVTRLLTFTIGSFLVLKALARRLLSSVPRDAIIWGPDPVYQNVHWSKAMKQLGYNSYTLMACFYARIHTRESFDMYYEDLVPRWVYSPSLASALGPYLAFAHILENAVVINTPLNGGPLGRTPLWRFEPHLLKWCGIASVVAPYGGDAWLPSQMENLSLKHGMHYHYPQQALSEANIRRRVHLWLKHADAVIAMHMLDGIGRSDVLLPAHFVLDPADWQCKEDYGHNDGANGVVRIAHTPNHRFCKGTEFIITAVQQLKREGLQIELILIEGMQNSEVRRLLPTVDILCEQLLQGMGLSSVEGMACGLPTVSNFEHESYRTLFRRFSFMNENPIVQASPEDVVEVLRTLVKTPSLRRELGVASRKYVEKYHSLKMAQYMFGSIYAKLLKKQQVDLFTLFHPLFSPYNNSTPKIQHPLENSRIPERYMIRVAEQHHRVGPSTALENDLDKLLRDTWTAYAQNLDTTHALTRYIYDLVIHAEDYGTDWRFWYTVALGYRLVRNYDHAELLYLRALSIERLPEILHELMLVASLRGRPEDSSRYRDMLANEFPHWPLGDGDEAEAPLARVVGGN